MINIERSCNYDVKFVATNNHVNLGTEKKITSLVVFLYNLYAGEKSSSSFTVKTNCNYEPHLIATS
jgi:hypothetical protein